MKPGRPLERRTPLARSSLARGGSSLKRTSQLKAKPVESKRRAEVRGAVFARDLFRCILADDSTALAALGPCYGRITPHHRKKASQGGDYSLANLTTICERHQVAIEDLPRAAFLLGLVIRSTPLRDTDPPTALT